MLLEEQWEEFVAAPAREAPDSRWHCGFLTAFLLSTLANRFFVENHVEPPLTGAPTSGPSPRMRAILQARFLLVSLRVGESMTYNPVPIDNSQIQLSAELTRL